jgi:hypothetical protein
MRPQLLVYLGLPTGALLLGASAIWERAGLLAPGGGLSLMAAKPARYAAAVLMGFLVNLSTAFAIKVTGSLTFKVGRLLASSRSLGGPPCPHMNLHVSSAGALERPDSRAG